MKRLVVACDGTWVNSDNGYVRDSWLPWNHHVRLATPSNVTRICRALLPRSTDGVAQVVYYQGGLGSEDNFYSFAAGGYLGLGFSENIREAYAFVCTNYEDGDEIILLGFSRGAFTARSIAGLIASVGLLTREGLDSFYAVFSDWEHQVDKAYKPQHGTDRWPNSRPEFSNPDYVPALKREALTRTDVPIKAIGVWDTVGTLGIPEIDVLSFTLFESDRREYSFVDTEVATTVEHAYQALALDEQRKPFSPTVWECPKPGRPSALKLLKQCWFPGVHSSIGGGYADTSISDITLAWMVTQLSRHLSFEPTYILEQQRLNKQYYSNNEQPIRSWAMGTIQRSDEGLISAMTGRRVRTPGQYCAMDPRTGQQTDRMLSSTCEFIHPSVRYRIQQKGPGLVTSKSSTGSIELYSPAALQGWTYCPPGQPWGREQMQDSEKNKKWDMYGKWLLQKPDGKVVFIVEENVDKDSAEMQLLDAWPGTAEKVLTNS